MKGRRIVDEGTASLNKCFSFDLVKSRGLRLIAGEAIDSFSPCLPCSSVVISLIRFALVAVMTTIAAINGTSPISAVAILIGAIVAALPQIRLVKQPPSEASLDLPDEEASTELEADITPALFPITSTKRHYRVLELQHIIASLKANAPILIVGEEGSGKSVLGTAVVEQLNFEGFAVALVEPTTPKQMLIEIAEQLGINIVSLKGKVLTSDELKRAIATFFESNTAFLVIDDAHICGYKFRTWLKSLKCQGVPMLLLATDPPRSDVFIGLTRQELTPLPECAILELMEQAALEQGISLKPYKLAFLQERARGNPMLAQRVVEEDTWDWIPKPGLTDGT